MSLIAFTPPSMGPSSYDATEASGRQSDRGADGPFGATLDQFDHQTARYNASEETPARESTPQRPDNDDRFLKRINHDRNREISDSSSSEKTREAEEVDGELITPEGQQSSTTEVESLLEPMSGPLVEPLIESRKQDLEGDPTYVSVVSGSLDPLTQLATLSPVATSNGNYPTPSTQSEITPSALSDDKRLLAESPLHSKPLSAPGTNDPHVGPPQKLDGPIDRIAGPSPNATGNPPASGTPSSTNSPTRQPANDLELVAEPATPTTTIEDTPKSAAPSNKLAPTTFSAITELSQPDSDASTAQDTKTLSTSAESVEAGIADPVTGVPLPAARTGVPSGGSGDQDHDQSSGMGDSDSHVSTVTTFAHSAQSKSQIDPTTLPPSRATHQITDLTRTAIVLRDRGQGPRLEATLSPPDLGRIRIELQGNGDSLTVRIQVAESQTLQMLQNSLSDLRQQLQSLGLDSGSIAITGWTEHTTAGQPDSRDNTADRFTREESHPMFKSRSMSIPLRKSTQIVDVIL
ncbi:MAG: flagellar hook-length control protein FliK [Planctomycetota bacterium]|nr:flagellar hook-length control protein FliK [Planctomycetota bacterium]MDA1179105.1 flagellar hook-length control protein FliK [Planctomycetota bacterium]